MPELQPDNDNALFGSRLCWQPNWIGAEARPERKFGCKCNPELGAERELPSDKSRSLEWRHSAGRAWPDRETPAGLWPA